MEQVAFFEKAIVLLAYLASVGLTIFTVARQRKKDKETNEAKFARKKDVEKDFKAMDKRINDVSKQAEINRKENLVAHKEIKDDIKDHFNTRFDDFLTHFDQRINDLKIK